ncbi:hypothetical protein E2C01_030324 [Portunus trituberculatus]|uniref:Uncharacterized protein n=1 Tax=Portunus trituberculatus TaxID=210409 RepID=A0A5B7EUG5_PORTR|nr:hypothetical protein [Portunus trituberculatus]
MLVHQALRVIKLDELSQAAAAALSLVFCTKQLHSSSGSRKVGGSLGKPRMACPGHLIPDVNNLR